MIKKLLFTALAFVFVTSTKAQVGYHIQIPPGFSGGTHILNVDSLYLSIGVTGKSNMMHVNPNTKAWEYLNTAYLPNYGTPVIKDKNNGLLRIPGSNSLQVTSDGWQTVTTSTASLPYVNKCPAGYYGHFNVGSNTTMVHSTNGLNWPSATLPGFLTILAARNYGNKIVALPATASSSLFTSTDGGLTYSGSANTSTFTGTFVDFYMASIDTFIVVMSGSLCKSFDAGATWTNTPLSGGPFTAAAFKNKNEFALQPQNAPPTFSYTTNGGATWAVNTNTPSVAGVGTLMYLNNYYYLYPWFRTNDYGVTWEHFLPNMAQYAYSVDFNGNKGLLGLQNGMYSYSIDKGRSFNHYINTLSSNQDMMAAKVLSNGNFLGGDRKGQIYTSNNNGQTWVQKNTETLSPNAIRFLTSVNENTVVLTRGGLPVVSVDACTSFSVVTYATSGGTHIQALKPNGQMMDMRATATGWEMRTFDIMGTTNIISTYTTTGSESIGAFYMVSNTDGYILTRDNVAKVNKIYKTTDGGITFTPKASIGQVVAGSSPYINGITSGIPLFHHFGTDTIIVTANFDNYYHVSYDGAVTWNTITPPFVPGNATYGNTIYRMNFFTHNSYLAITGDGFGPLGLYLNTQGTTGTNIGIKELLSFNGKKNDLILFPNPSQNNNLVSFLNLEDEVEVNIFNLSGELLRSIKTSSGSFSAENLPSGLYIVQVKEHNKTPRTAKLVIQ